MRKIAILLILLLTPLATMGFFVGTNNLMGIGGNSGNSATPSTGDAILWDASGDTILWDASGDKILWD